MEPGQITVPDGLAGTMVDSTLSQILQLPSGARTVAVNADPSQNFTTFNQFSDPGLKSVGTVFATGGQRMTLPIVVTSAAAASGSQSVLHNELQTGFVTTLGNQSGMKVVFANSNFAERTTQNIRTSQGKQRSGVSPSVKQMIAQGVHAKRKTSLVSPTNLVQPLQSQPISISQPVSNVLGTQLPQPKTGVISAAGSMKTAGPDQPVSMSFQTSDGQLITLPVIVKPSPAKSNKIVRTKTKAELKMVGPQTLSLADGSIAKKNVNINIGTQAAFQNLPTQTNMTNIQLQAGNIHIKPQTSTGLQVIGGAQPGTRTVTLPQTSQVKSQPMLTLQTTDAAGNKVMVPVMLNALTKNTPGTQIKLVPVGNISQSTTLQGNTVSDSVIHNIMQQEVSKAQQRIPQHVTTSHVSVSPHELMTHTSEVSFPAESEFAAISNTGQPEQANQSQVAPQGQSDDGDDSAQPLIADNVIPWLLAPRGNKPVPIKSTSNKTVVNKAARPTSSSPLVAKMHIKCPCYCPPECSMSHHPLLVALLNCPDDPDESIMRQRMQMFSFVFNTHINNLPDIHDPVPDVLNQYRVPLGHWAAALGRVECFRYLLRRGFKVASQAKRTRETPLHFALRALPSTSAKDGIEKLQQMMPILGLAALVPNAEGSTSLHVCAELLTIAARDTNKGNETDGNVQFYVKAMSLLLTFTSEKSQELMLRLINSTNLKGDTALHMLSGKDNLLKVMTLLVELGADTEIKNFRGATPLSTAIIAKATRVVGYLTSENVQRAKVRSATMKSEVDMANPVLVNMLQSGTTFPPFDAQPDAIESEMSVDQMDMVADGNVMNVADHHGQTEMAEVGFVNNDGIIKTELETNLVSNIPGMVQTSHVIEDSNQIVTMATGNNIIQDAAVMSQIAAATSLIAQPSTVPQTNVVQGIKPELGRPIPSVLDTTRPRIVSNSEQGQIQVANQAFNQIGATSTIGENVIAAANTNQAYAKKTTKPPAQVLNHPANSHVIQFIPPANSHDGKPGTPITVYVNSSDGKPLNLTPNDLLTLTQALQAANIGKDKSPTGPVQVILQQNEGSGAKQGSDLSKTVDEVIDVYQTSNQDAQTVGVQNVAGANVAQLNTRQDVQGQQQVLENHVQSGTGAQQQVARAQPQASSDINQITLDDLTAILKADEHSGGLEFLTSDDAQQTDTENNAKIISQQVAETVTRPVARSNRNITQVTTTQYVPVQLLGQPQAAIVSQSQGQLTGAQNTFKTTVDVNSAQTTITSSSQTKLQSYPQVGQLLARAPLNASPETPEAASTRKRPHEQSEQPSPDSQVIKWAKHDATHISDSEPSLFPDETVIKSLKGDQELFEYLQKCDKVTQKDVLNSLTEQFLNSKKDCEKLRVSIQVVDRDFARVEEIRQDTVDNMKIFINKLSDLEEEDKNLTFDSTSFRNEILMCINTQESLRERLTHCDAALAVLNNMRKQRPNSGGCHIRVSDDDDSESELSDLDSSRLTDVEDDASSKEGLLPPITYSESGQPVIEDTPDLNSIDVELYTKDQASARIKNEDTKDNELTASEGVTDVEFTEGSTLNTTMESVDLDAPRSPTDTLPVECIDYQELDGLQSTFRSSRDDLLFSSQGSYRSVSSIGSSRVAQVVPNSQETINSSRWSMYSSQGSMLSTQSTVDSRVSSQSTVSSQGSVLPAEECLLEPHATILTSQDFARSEECVSSQESINSQIVTDADESAPCSQVMPNEGAAAFSQEVTTSQDEVVSEDTANSEELLSSQEEPSEETNSEVILPSPEVLPRQIETSPSNSQSADPEELIGSQELITDSQESFQSQEVTTMDNLPILMEDGGIVQQISDPQNADDSTTLVTSQENAQTSLRDASEDVIVSSSQELPISESQELFPEPMETEEVPLDSVAMVTEADDALLLSQELVSSSQEEVAEPDSQELVVFTQHQSVNNEVVSTEIDVLLGESEVVACEQTVSNVEVVGIENGAQSTFDVTLDANGNQELYVMSEPVDSQDIEFVSEEIQFVTQDSSMTSQEFAPVTLEENLEHDIEQGIYSQSSGALDQELLLGSQELIEDDNDNLIVSQDILVDSRAPQEFVVASNFDEFLV